MPGKYHFFWQTGSPFSQWHRSNYTLDGYQYSTAEQGMMHGKALLFGDENIAAQILATSDPRKIKKLGRQVRGFNDREWKKNREIIVYRNSVAKFTQHDHLLQALLETKGLLVEASPSDKIWGIGLHENDAKRIPEKNWKGLNLLGKILTRVRDEILAAGEHAEGDGDMSSDKATLDDSPENKLKIPPGAKVVYMIRHGQSEGQASSRRERKNGANMRDCDITRKGRKEADGVAGLMSRQDFESIELVVSSPLTRALHTSLRAFPKKNIIVNYDLRELGSDIPENIPREMAAVLKDLAVPLSYRNDGLLLDTDSLQPEGWPNPPLAKDKIKNALRWLAQERDESTIAVVCHYNVIREAIQDGQGLKPANAVPIRCCLYPSGELILLSS